MKSSNNIEKNIGKFIQLLSILIVVFLLCLSSKYPITYNTRDSSLSGLPDVLYARTLSNHDEDNNSLYSFIESQIKNSDAGVDSDADVDSDGDGYSDLQENETESNPNEYRDNPNHSHPHSTEPDSLISNDPSSPFSLTHVLISVGLLGFALILLFSLKHKSKLTKKGIQCFIVFGILVGATFLPSILQINSKKTHLAIENKIVLNFDLVQCYYSLGDNKTEYTLYSRFNVNESTKLYAFHGHEFVKVSPQFIYIDDSDYNYNISIYVVSENRTDLVYNEEDSYPYKEENSHTVKYFDTIEYTCVPGVIYELTLSGQFNGIIYTELSSSETRLMNNLL